MRVAGNEGGVIFEDSSGHVSRLLDLINGLSLVTCKACASYWISLEDAHHFECCARRLFICFLPGPQWDWYRATSVSVESSAVSYAFSEHKLTSFWPALVGSHA